MCQNPPLRIYNFLSLSGQKIDCCSAKPRKSIMADIGALNQSVYRTTNNINRLANQSRKICNFSNSNVITTKKSLQNCRSKKSQRFSKNGHKTFTFLVNFYGRMGRGITQWWWQGAWSFQRSLVLRGRRKRKGAQILQIEIVIRNYMIKMALEQIFRFYSLKKA